MHTCALVCGTRDARHSPTIYILSRAAKAATRGHFSPTPLFPAQSCCPPTLPTRPSAPFIDMPLAIVTRFDHLHSTCVCSDFARNVLLQPGGKRVPIKDIHRHRHLANENISHLGSLQLCSQASLSNIISVRDTDDARRSFVKIG